MVAASLQHVILYQIGDRFIAELGRAGEAWLGQLVVRWVVVTGDRLEAGLLGWVPLRVHCASHFWLNHQSDLLLHLMLREGELVGRGCRELQLLLLVLWQLHRERVLHSRGRGGGRLAGWGPAAHFLPFEMRRPATTPKVAVPERTRWTEWIPSSLRPPAWPMEVLLWLVGVALHMVTPWVLPGDSWHGWGWQTRPGLGGNGWHVDQHEMPQISWEYWQSQIKLN